MTVTHTYVLLDVTDEHEQVKYHRRFTPHDRVTVHRHGHVPESPLGEPRDPAAFCYARGCYSLVPQGVPTTPAPPPPPVPAKEGTAAPLPDPREDWHAEGDHPGPWQDCDRCTYRLRTGERHKDDPAHGGVITEDNITEEQSQL